MANKREIIQKVFVNKSNGQKFVTIPKHSGINEGDFVRIEKMKVIKDGNP